MKLRDLSPYCHGTVGPSDFFFSLELTWGKPYDGKGADIWSLDMRLYVIPIKEVEEKDCHRDLWHSNSPLCDTWKPNSLDPHRFPEVRCSTEDSERHPWVMICELYTQKETYPDSNIIDMLWGMGFNANEILESLKKNKYGKIMGPY